MTDRPLTTSELKRLRAIAESARRSPDLVKDNTKAFYDPVRDGVTFSALETFKRCREMSRLNLKGVTSRASSTSLVFGTVAHAALQAVYDAVRTKRLRADVPTDAYVKNVLQVTEATWKRDNPRASQETLQFLEFSMLLAEATLPRYFRYWSSDFTGGVKWLALEKEFKIPIAVPVYWQKTPFKTYIRGKMDGNFKDHGLRLFETKTKSHIDDETIASILPHELQVNIYLWAMRRYHGERPAGVRYNLIRRPQLRQKQSETFGQFATRCAADVNTRPDWYFMRLDMDVNQQDMDRFEGEFMDLLSDFLSWWYGYAGHYKESNECENKYGRCHFLAICGRKEFGQFYRRDTVFRELEEI